MSETKGLVKCILGFVLSIVVIVGSYFGLDVQANVQDAETSPPEVVETTETYVEEVETTESVVETEQSTVETTETADEEIPVDESVEN